MITEENPDARVLKNPQHETFVREFIATGKAVYAYRKARGLDTKGTSGHKQANEWLNEPTIRYRIKMIQQGMMNKVSDAVSYTEAWIKDQTKALIEGGIALEPVMHRGEPVIDRVGEDEIPRMKFRDSPAAAKGLDMASRQLGLYSQVREPNENENKSDEELISEYRALNDQLEGATKALTNLIDSTEGTEAPTGASVRSVPEAN